MKTKDKKKNTRAILDEGVLKKKVNGYMFIKVGEKWMPEHRLIVENYIGRYLEKEEVIHHIDGERDNNDIKNLMIFPNQKEHTKFHVNIQKFGLTNEINKKIEERWKNI